MKGQRCGVSGSFVGGKLIIGRYIYIPHKRGEMTSFIKNNILFIYYFYYCIQKAFKILFISLNCLFEFNTTSGFKFLILCQSEFEFNIIVYCTIRKINVE